MAEAKLEKLQAEKREAAAALAAVEARAAAAEAELADARAASGRTTAEATRRLQARISELSAAHDAADAAAEKLREQVTARLPRPRFHYSEAKVMQ